MLSKLKPLLPYAIFFPALLATVFYDFAVQNAVVQFLWFIPSALIPAAVTGRMSYVDIAWPWGLVLLGAQGFMVEDGYWLRKYIVSAQYLAAGLRMGGGAALMATKGAFNKEFPRYQYQRRRWDKHGETNIPLAMQIEITVQMFANATFLCIPLLLQTHSTRDSLNLVEIVGYILWFAALAMESVADGQKLAFAAHCKKNNLRAQTCKVGLWRYSRHPNYFAEWMVWNALVISSLPSWLDMLGSENTIAWILVLIGLFAASYCMYFCLVYYTGSKPAEYYSAQKRPDYKEYQRTTNMFFPWFPTEEGKSK